MTSKRAARPPADAVRADPGAAARRAPGSKALQATAAAAAAIAVLMPLNTAHAAPVIYEITGTLNRTTSAGSGLEAYIASVGFDGGLFAATVRLETGTPDLDARPGEARFFGAVVESTLKVGATQMASGFCSPNVALLDCSVAVSNDAPVAAGVLSDTYRLSSQVFAPAGNTNLLPASSFTFLKYDLSTLVVALGGVGPALLTATEIDPGLDSLPGLVFDLGLRTSGNELGVPNVLWTANDLVIRRLNASAAAVPEPATWALACLALACLPATRRRPAPKSRPAARRVAL